MKTLWIVLLVLVLTGCAPSQTGYSDPTKIPLSNLIPAQPTQGDEPQMKPLLATPLTSGLEGLIETAKQDLAQRLSIPISDIVLVDVKEVTWSDASLGCPQPDMMYAQVLTPGYLVKLKYDIREFEYHAGKDRSLTYCKNPLPPVEGAASDT